MSVTVKLPGTYLGKELSDAIEEAGNRIGWIVDRRREIYYKPGSVEAEELQSAFHIIKPKEVIKSVGGRLAWFRNKKEYKMQRVASMTRIDIVVPAEGSLNSVNFEVFVPKECCGLEGPSWFAPKSIRTSDPDFAREIQPDFEKFLAHLFKILEAKSAVAQT